MNHGLEENNLDAYKGLTNKKKRNKAQMKSPKPNKAKVTLR